MKKKFLCLMLTLVVVFSLVPSAVAANDEATQAAQTLYELGLFRGTGTNPDGTPIFALEQTPTRNQAVIMLVRLLGKEEEALAGDWSLPFTDVAKDSTAFPYIGYAYANGLTSGTTATTYSGTNPIKANQYITFVLRALGYESGKDFQVGTSYLLSDQLGITHGEYANATTFTRGAVAKISLGAHEVQEVLKTASYFGLPADIRWIANPETMEDMDNNILYSFLFGNYSLNFKQFAPYLASGHNLKDIRRAVANSIKRLSQNYPELVGVFRNTLIGCGITADGVLFIDFPESTLNTETIYTQQQAVLNEALRVKAMLWEKGKIKAGMSQLQIAKVYESYLFGLNVVPGIQKSDPTCWEYDSAYAALINRKADCVGRAAAFNLLLNAEGIAAKGVAGSFHGTNSGHVLSRVVLDGKEYFSDWGNRRQIGTKETYETTHGFWFDPESLEAARAVK